MPILIIASIDSLICKFNWDPVFCSSSHYCSLNVACINTDDKSLCCLHFAVTDVDLLLGFVCAGTCIWIFVPWIDCYTTWMLQQKRISRAYRGMWTIGVQLVQLFKNKWCLPIVCSNNLSSLLYLHEHGNIKLAWI